jgi:hypothetical protein
VLIPCVLHIAMLRQLHALKESGYDPGTPQVAEADRRRKEILFGQFN